MKRIVFVFAIISMIFGGSAFAAAKLKVVGATEDLASLTREVGGDKVDAVAIGKGYQDPHFIEPKPSFLLLLKNADLLVVVGLELEIGWLPPLLDQSRNNNIRPGATGYLDVSQGVEILDRPTANLNRSMGDVHPLGNPHYWLDPANAVRIAIQIQPDRPEFHFNLARALHETGALSEAADAFRSAVTSALPSDKPAAVGALLDQAFISWPSGGPALATPLLEQARQLAADCSATLRLRADTAWAFSTFVGGDHAGIRVIDAAVQDALANPEADTTDFAWSWGTLGTYGNMAKWTERFADATRAYEIGMAAAERMGLPVAIAAVAVMHGDTCLRTGRLGEALRLADRATVLADLAPERAFWAAIIHCYTLNEMGQMDECREWFRRSTALADPDENWDADFEDDQSRPVIFQSAAQRARTVGVESSHAKNDSVDVLISE